MQKQGKWGSDWMRMNVMEFRVSLVLATFPFLVLRRITLKRIRLKRT